MPRLSGITPSGHVHLGNYLGAMRHWATERHEDDLFFIADLHAMTTAYHPQRLRALTREQFAVLLASGIDPEAAFVQSDLVGELGALNWILECTCSYGEAARMIQFKEKARPTDSGENAANSVRLGLLTYPLLMAADILLQGATDVPVGADQNQHVELAQTLARRFNSSRGEVFAVPRAVVPRTAARIADLNEPSRKMAKSTQQANGVIFVLDEPDVVERKIRRAATDNAAEVRYDPATQPGVSNLLEILAACRDISPYAAAEPLGTYSALKGEVTDAVIEALRPMREQTRSLLDDPGELERLRRRGAENARLRAQERLEGALRMSGLR